MNGCKSGCFEIRRRWLGLRTARGRGEQGGSQSAQAPPAAFCQQKSGHRTARAHRRAAPKGRPAGLPRHLGGLRASVLRVQGGGEDTENNLFVTEVKLLGKMASLLPFRGEDQARTSSNAFKSLLRRVSAPPYSLDNNSISNNSHLL